MNPTPQELFNKHAKKGMIQYDPAGFSKDFSHLHSCILAAIGEALGDWISVQDRLPGNDDTNFSLIFGRDPDFRNPDIYVAYLGDDDKTWFYRDIQFEDVTHWRNLPTPPNK